MPDTGPAYDSMALVGARGQGSIAVAHGPSETARAVESRREEGGRALIAPLAEIRVVEIASFVAAPAGGALLADLGAEVIKVEVPRGELYRYSRPKLMG